MVEEGPYEILPYAEIDNLKKEIDGLKRKSASSDEILDAINRLTKIMESMLHLFESAAAGMKKEGEGSLGKKIDKLLKENETIAESILSVADIIKEGKPEEKEPYVVKKKAQPTMPPEPMPRFEPNPDFSMAPDFERPKFQRPPTPSMPMQPPGQEPMPPKPGPEGPIPMPTGSFKDLDLEKPKKGLFGKFIKFKK
jgi:hypothetical protein